VVLTASFALTCCCRSGMKQDWLFHTFRITGDTTLVKYQHICIGIFLRTVENYTDVEIYFTPEHGTIVK
jgi:hypothetical protein